MQFLRNLLGGLSVDFQIFRCAWLKTKKEKNPKCSECSSLSSKVYYGRY